MTSNQRDLLRSILTALTLVKTMEQVDTLWVTVSALSKEAGVDVGAKPTSLPQARTTAQALIRKILS